MANHGRATNFPPYMETGIGFEILPCGHPAYIGGRALGEVKAPEECGACRKHREEKGK